MLMLSVGAAPRPDWTKYVIFPNGGEYEVESRSPEAFVVRAKRTDDELKTLALWIDLGVPFVGGYCECNTWTDVQKRRYLWFQNKRVYFAWQELNDIRREKGLAPVPIDGYVPGIDKVFCNFCCGRSYTQ